MHNESLHAKLLSPYTLHHLSKMGRNKNWDGYVSWSYLEPGFDFESYPLAKQVNSVVKDLGNGKIKSHTIYGGVSINNQIRQLEQGIHIIVGTPGRIIDLYKRRKLNLS